MPWTHHETNHPLRKPPSSLSWEWALRQLPLQRGSWWGLPRTLANPFGIDLIQGVQRCKAGLLGVFSSHVWADLLCWCKSRLIWAFHVGMMPGMHICIIFVFFFKSPVRFQACEEISCRAGKLSNHQPKQSEGQLLLGDAEFSLVLERSSEQTGEKGPFLRADRRKRALSQSFVWEPLHEAPQLTSENLRACLWKGCAFPCKKDCGSN